MRPLPSALAEEAGTVVETADDKLLAALGDAPYYYAHLRHPLTDAKVSSRARIDDYACTATRLIRAGTHWTKRHPQIIEDPLNERNFQTHQDGLERAQANS